MNPTTSLLDRANLDRDSVRHEVARGLSGADDGELFLEYSQTGVDVRQWPAEEGDLPSRRVRAARREGRRLGMRTPPTSRCRR